MKLPDFFSHQLATDERYLRDQEVDNKRKHDFKKFASLIGKELDYYGCDVGEGTFKLGDQVFRVLEDEEDGYRSCLGVVEQVQETKSIFFKSPIARVVLVDYERRLSFDHVSFNGYRIMDPKDNHVWLKFGTDYTDDLYPYFVFQHFPKN